MKKQIRKAMICTIAMMLIGVVSLTGVTYAWFSKADFATVNGLEMNVLEADGGVYISKSPYSGFGISIDVPVSVDLMFTSVSSAGGIDSNTGKLKFFSGTIPHPDAITLTSEAITTPGNYYIEQDVYFDNSTGSGAITISLNGSTITPATVDGVTKNVQLATRVAVVTHGAISKAQFDSGEAYPNVKDQEHPEDFVQIWETNPIQHTALGRAEYTKYHMPEGSTAPVQGIYKYYAVNAITNVGETINRVDGTATKLTNMSTLMASDEVTPILKQSADDVQIVVPAGHYLKTTLYVWIEGQDPDCQNDVSGNSYTANIRFTKVGSDAEVTETEAPTETTPPAES